MNGLFVAGANRRELLAHRLDGEHRARQRAEAAGIGDGDGQRADLHARHRRLDDRQLGAEDTEQRLARRQCCQARAYLAASAPIARVLNRAARGIDAGARLARAIVARVLHLLLDRRDRLVERRDDAVHGDVQRGIEAVALDAVEIRAAPPVPLPVVGREVALEEDARARNVREHGFGHVQVADGVIDVDAHRAVVEREMLVDGQELQRLRIARERVGEVRRGPRDHLAEDALVAAARDDRETARDGGAQAAAVIEVMVRDDDVRDLLAGHERVGDVEPRERVGLVVVGLEHHEVIGELDDGAAVAADAHVPNLVGDLRRFGAALGGRRRATQAPGTPAVVRVRSDRSRRGTSSTSGRANPSRP